MKPEPQVFFFTPNQEQLQKNATIGSLPGIIVPAALRLTQFLNLTSSVG
jgi:hypothetical protein